MNVSFPTISNKISSFFARYHFIIFFVFIGSGLIAAVAITNATLTQQDDGYVSKINDTGFDQATMQRLRALKTTGETVDKLDFSGRTTPY